MVPRLIAFCLRRAFHLRDPQRRQRLQALVTTEESEKRRIEAHQREQKRIQDCQQKRFDHNMVRRLTHARLVPKLRVGAR